MTVRTMTLAGVALVAVVGLTMVGSWRWAQAGGPGQGQISITKRDSVLPDLVAAACFNVSNGQPFPIFQVCDNDFQGSPAMDTICVPDAVCGDDEPGDGLIRVSIAAGDYSVQESKAPPGYNLDPEKKFCLVPVDGQCELTFKDEKVPVGGIAELPNLARRPLEAEGSSGPSASVVGGVVAAVAAGALALGGAAWYVRRRLG